MATESTAERVLCISLNQSHTCFTVGTTQGFRVFELQPLKIRYRRGLLFFLSQLSFHNSFTNRFTKHS